MNCENYLNLLDDLIEKKLAEHTSEEILSHLLSCQSCEAEFEIRFDEKEICVDFLFEITPVNNLSEQFQQNLKLEKQKQVTLPSFRSSWNERLKNIFDFFSLKPVLASIAVVMIFGLITWQSIKAIKDEESKNIAQSITSETFPAENITDRAHTQDQLQIGKTGSSIPTKPTNKVNRALSAKTAEKKSRSVVSATALIKKPTIDRNEIQKTVEISKAADRDAIQLTDIRTFMAETERQMEKVEMLFRSFRNARIDEGSDYFDVAYESQRARKLLKRNTELRKFAESHGSYDVEETLQTTEVLLGEIARLKGNSLREKVIPVKRRVSNQNIIAALQIF